MHMYYVIYAACVRIVSSYFSINNYLYNWRNIKFKVFETHPTKKVGD